MWLGNVLAQPLSLTGLELFGFNTGSYEERIVSSGKRCPGGIPWRLCGDLDLVCYEKKLLPLCSLIHRAATQQGLADVQLREHLLEPMLHPAALGISKSNILS